MKFTVQAEQSIMTELWDPALADNLYEFVKFVYPWDTPGTPLAGIKGPRLWQIDELNLITEHITKQKHKMDLGLTPEIWRSALMSGRGPGKSALLSWLVDWMITTRLGSAVVVTANNETQLKTRVFAEIGKWTTMLINAHWFETSVLSIKPAPWFKAAIEDQLKINTQYYNVIGQLWSEESPDSFVGIHNLNGVMLIFDEASGIPTPIFDVSAGFFTEPVLNRFWYVSSNPRRNSGGFYECFHNEKVSPLWHLRQIDARTVEGADNAYFQQLIDSWGVGSDKVRIEILGKFPKQGDRQFISNELAEAARKREVDHDIHAPLIMGVDAARYGNDITSIWLRQGRDARSIPPIRFAKRDNMFIANEIARLIDKMNPDAVNIDAGGGQGIIDRLRELKYRVNEVQFGGKALNKEWANRRTEMWGAMRDWLGGGAIPADPDLFQDLTAPEYDYFGKASDSVMLEPKESLKRRGYDSPDDGDALALTFAVPVARRDIRSSRYGNRSRTAQDVDYPLF